MKKGERSAASVKRGVKRRRNNRRGAEPLQVHKRGPVKRLHMRLPPPHQQALLNLTPEVGNFVSQL